MEKTAKTMSGIILVLYGLYRLLRVYYESIIMGADDQARHTLRYINLKVRVESVGVFYE